MASKTTQKAIEAGLWEYFAQSFADMVEDEDFEKDFCTEIECPRGILAVVKGQIIGHVKSYAATREAEAHSNGVVYLNPNYATLYYDSGREEQDFSVVKLNISTTL